MSVDPTASRIDVTNLAALADALIEAGTAP